MVTIYNCDEKILDQIIESIGSYCINTVKYKEHNIDIELDLRYVKIMYDYGSLYLLRFEIAEPIRKLEIPSRFFSEVIIRWLKRI